MDISSLVFTIITGVVIGLVILIVEYRTRWFAQWSQRPISDSNPDAEELLSQELYTQRCVDLINNARNQVIIRTSKMNKSGDLSEAAVVNQAIQNARRKDVKIRVLVAANYDRLPGAIELTEIFNTDVRFDPEIPMSDINYYCADGSHLVVATRQALRELEHRRSTSWIEFRSTFLAFILSKEFEKRWEAVDTRRLKEYMYEVLPPAIKSQGADAVGEFLGKKVAIIEEYNIRKPFIVYIIGRPGSGKTAIAELLKKNLTLTGLYRNISQVSDLEFLANIFGKRNDPETRFEETEDGGFFILDNSLYEEALLYLSTQTRQKSLIHDLVIVEFARKDYLDSIEFMEKKGITPNVIVYVDVNYETALERNKLRSLSSSEDNHFVSEKEMKGTYAEDDIDELLKQDKFKVVVINNNQDVIAGLAEKVFSIIAEVKDAT